MAGKLIVDTIDTDNAFITLNVQQATIATMNTSGIFSNTGTKMIGSDGSISATLSSPTISGRILGDFSNGTLANRLAFQTSTTNSATGIIAYPNGTSEFAGWYGFTNTTANASYVGITVDGTNTNIVSDKTGTGTYLPLRVFTGGDERLRIDTSGNVGIGTGIPTGKLDVSSGSAGVSAGDLVVDTANKTVYVGRQSSTSGDNSYLVVRGRLNGNTANQALVITGDTTAYGTGLFRPNNDQLGFSTVSIERMRLTSDGELLVGKTSPTSATVGCELRTNGILAATRSAGPPASFNRTTNDGDIVSLQQDGTQEGSISVSGTTVSYNGGHLSRYAQIANGNTNIILKGTVLSNLDEMNVYIDADDNPVTNEQLNKVKVSDTEGDANVAGVFVNWAYDEQHDIEEINMAMTGDMIIRIAEGVTVARGDLLMSAGDGTAKPQGDDIVRSKTIAKVTSTHVTCTYEDGSYCVPCVLMAC